VIERIRTAIKPAWHGHRNVLIGAAALVIVALVGTGLLVSASSGKTPAASPSPSASPSPIAVASPTDSPTPEPTPSPSPTVDLNPTAIPSGWEYSDLDGVAAPPELAHRLPMAVMVDDNAVARPQSGFSSASIVYQAMADGGEDRYMMVFQEGTATDIGPTRSARPYFVSWVAEYKALYAHVGGDAKTLQQTIPTLSRYIYNEDELNGGSCAYHRISTRAAPHNDYTNSAVLIGCAAKRGYPATYQKLPTRPFTDDEPAWQMPASQSITIPYRTGTVGYEYVPATDSYNRIIGGKPQIDPANNQQVVARNIVVMFQAYAIVPSVDEMRPDVYNVGSGKAIVFKEGEAIAATWKKASTTALTRFYDSSGYEIPFVRGEIFMQSVPIGTAVTYK
jgi:hypothetical protein